LHEKLTAAGIVHEILVVNDGSKDGTWQLLQNLQKQIPVLHPVNNGGLNGIGRAIVCGLDAMSGDAAVIMMADESDSPDDVVRYWQKLNEGHECVFGSRFIKGGSTEDYPRVKYAINRVVNYFIRVLFQITLNDTTNAFKAYRREVIEGCRPLISPHFNLLVELPLKAIVRGYSWTVIPISWKNRRTGEAKLKIKEMGSRYFFSMMYVLLEKYYSLGDYQRQTQQKK
ncbi:MAG: glycosyltransferase family 2 protein, partial [Verrucomicrobiaceae bacterium]